MNNQNKKKFILKILHENLLFPHLNEKDLDQVIKISQLIQLPPGGNLFHEGELVEHIHVVGHGLVRVYQAGPKGGRRLVLHMAAPPESIGEIAAMSERRFYPVTAEAAMPSVIVRVPLEQIARMMDERPRFTRALLRSISERQFDLLMLLRRVAFFEVQSRLAQYLLDQHAIHGSGFPLPTNPEMAAILGTVPEIVSRTINRMHKQGWIRLEGRRVWIENEAVLIIVAKG